MGVGSKGTTSSLMQIAILEAAAENERRQAIRWKMTAMVADSRHHELKELARRGLRPPRADLHPFDGEPDRWRLATTEIGCLQVRKTKSCIKAGQLISSMRTIGVGFSGTVR